MTPKYHDPALQLGKADRAENETFSGTKKFTSVLNKNHIEHQPATFAERIIARRFGLPHHVARQICNLAGLGVPRG